MFFFKERRLSSEEGSKIKILNVQLFFLRPLTNEKQMMKEWNGMKQAFVISFIFIFIGLFFCSSWFVRVEEVLSHPANLFEVFDVPCRKVILVMTCCKVFIFCGIYSKSSCTINNYKNKWPGKPRTMRESKLLLWYQVSVFFFIHSFSVCLILM